MRNILYFIIAFVGFKYFRKFAAADRLDWYIKGIRSKGNVLGLTLFLNIDIINKTPEDIKFNFIKADLKINGDIVGKIDYRTTKTIKPGVTKLEIPIKLKPLYSVTQLITKINTLNLNFITIGIINFEGVNFDIYENIKIL